MGSSLKVTRRQFGASLATAGGLTLISRRARAADFPMRQHHNQPPESPLHKRLVEMWTTINTETAGRVEVEVFPAVSVRRARPEAQARRRCCATDRSSSPW